MSCIDNCRQGRWPCATPERCGLLITRNSDGSASDEAADQPPIAPEDFGSRLWWFVTCCAFIVLLAVLGIPTWLAMGA